MNSVIYIVGYALVLWDFPKIGVPLIIQFNRISHYKPSILRYLHLWKPPYMAYSSILTCPCTVEWPHCDRTLEWWLFFGRSIPKISLFIYIYTHTFFHRFIYLYIFSIYVPSISPGSIHPSPFDNSRTSPCARNSNDSSDPRASWPAAGSWNKHGDLMGFKEQKLWFNGICQLKLWFN